MSRERGNWHAAMGVTIPAEEAKVRMKGSDQG
jgi:hypothetical protein